MWWYPLHILTQNTFRLMRAKLHTQHTGTSAKCSSPGRCPNPNRRPVETPVPSACSMLTHDAVLELMPGQQRGVRKALHHQWHQRQLQDPRRQQGASLEERQVLGR
jgi:hypothetical protein